MEIFVLSVYKKEMSICRKIQTKTPIVLDRQQTVWNDNSVQRLCPIPNALISNSFGIVSGSYNTATNRAMNMSFSFCSSVNGEFR
jgi:hypothetical protein